MTDKVVEGTVHSVFVNREDFCIGTLMTADTNTLVTFLGKFSSFPGEELRAEGYYHEHAVHGIRFIVTNFNKKLPRSPEKLVLLLASGIIPGVGPSMSQKLVDHFGNRVIDVLEGQSSTELREVSGIGRNKATKIIQGWSEYRGQAHVLAFFLNAGFGLDAAKKMIRRFQPNPEKLLRDNPYRIAWMPGVGWGRADKFAMKLGLGRLDPRRVAAAILYTLLNASHGHTYLPHELLRGEAGLRAGVDFDSNDQLFLDAIAELTNEKQIVVTKEGVYHKLMFFDEKSIAQNMVELEKYPMQGLSKTKLDGLIDEYEQVIKTELSEGQRKAIGLAFNRGATVITGGPGTGKTLSIGGIIYVAKKLQLTYKIAAPTGRAARKITESTGNKASTVHRMLDFQPFGDQDGMFAHNKKNPLEVDILIVDETSMMDTVITAALVKSLKPGTRLIFTGDSDQLESVGAGNVLKDIIDSNMFHVTHLNKIFRQAAESKIIVNARRINSGLPLEPGDDFFWMEKPSVDMLKRTILRIMEKYNTKNLSDIQIVTPFRKRITDFNITTLNEIMQEMLNPNGAALPITDCVFRVGDKMIQNVNNYEKDVFNGDIGYISAIEPGFAGMEGYFRVKFDTGEVDYHFREWKQLDLAYAITAHKSQGGEYLYVIVVLPPDRKADIMLRRNLIYTAVTRASKLCVLMGRPREVNKAIETKRTVERFTGLRSRLLEIRFGKK